MRHLLAGKDYLFDLAAQASHLDSMKTPFDDHAVNATAQLQLLEICRDIVPGIVVVHAGTRQIYGRPRYIPVDEAHPLNPTDVNGVNKMAGESFHLMFHGAYGLKTRSLRLTNVYGPGMRIKDARQNFLGIWLRRTLEGEAFEVWGGEQRRDMVFVDDAVEAFLAAAVTPETEGSALNVGGDAAYCLTQIAAAMIAANGGGRYESKEISARTKAHRHRRFRHLDDRRFRTLTGWAPRTALADEPQALARLLPPEDLAAYL